MEQRSWKLLVACFILLCAAVLLLLAYVLSFSGLGVLALALAFVGIAKGVLVIFDQEDVEDENGE